MGNRLEGPPHPELQWIPGLVLIASVSLLPPPHLGLEVAWTASVSLPPPHSLALVVAFDGLGLFSPPPPPLRARGCLDGVVGPGGEGR